MKQPVRRNSSLAQMKYHTAIRINVTTGGEL